jgi:KTSC domain
MSRRLDVRKAEAALKRAAHKAVHGTPEERSGRVVSSVLRSIKYDRNAKVLELRFVTGTTYRYADVPPEVHQRLMNAESRGAFFNANIKDAFPYRKVVD